MSGFIRTVTGDIKPDELGITYCHDHLAVYPVKGVKLDQRLLIDDKERTLEELLRFKDVGGCSIVDAQPFGAGRNPEVLRFLSEKSGINIIGSTGHHKLFFYPDDFYSFWFKRERDDDNGNAVKRKTPLNSRVEELAGLFISEIKEGMWYYNPSNPFYQRSFIKAGLIKIATNKNGLKGYYKRVFEAAALASKETNAPVMTHTELGLFAEEQIEFLTKKGIDENRIIISHLDRKIDINRCKRIAGSGVFLQFDTIHRLKYHSDEEEAGLILALVESGYAENILLGMDSTRDRMKSYGSYFGLDYILTDFKKLLFEYGLDEETFQAMVVKNPARALSIDNC